MTEVVESDVRARLEEVNGLIDRYTLNLAMLRKEQEELQVAVRVFERFHQRADYAKDLPPEAEIKTAAAGEGVAVTYSKPVVLPTVPEMIVEALRHAREELGTEGWEPKAILAYIRDHYWPQAAQTSVGPIAWRMAQEGRLQKRGSLYCLPGSETPPAATGGVSEPGEEDGTL